ncbi:type I CRISPR-associated protein Cas7 [Pontibacter sp. G13]|uniref:type I CRISPR-associated protein Cas7 n=1 Tax=Pontibacter sp. G13 TaxID=3074898 RepID=UPI00288AAC88|nr:type I CRISPR-associated protein Cas7 [Pontibacter sp. G13]WNJ18157.1 type I CRISPR-associated protein Cas7 [Pontibacter sp. G13]
MSNNTIKQNSDFLFLYEAIMCNPNGDPDQENRPRMDYDTNRNLVTDVRVKRNIREYLKQTGKQIFIDTESGEKVGMETRIESVLQDLLQDSEYVKGILGTPELVADFEKLIGKSPVETLKKIRADKKGEIFIVLVDYLVRNVFQDIQWFGSALAIKGYPKNITGPIQLNWGYSLNEVFLMESPTITSIMNDGNSTMGKDYRVKYSLLAFHGSINAHAARETHVREEDLDLFRTSIWEGTTASPTRSKLNQYPKLYLEVKYKPGVANGKLGDLRNLISTAPVAGKEPRQVLAFKDLELDISPLQNAIEHLKATEDCIEDVIFKYSPDLQLA